MARKDEKQKGVYAILNVETKLAYVGKSNGVGAIMRSVKSKLKKGTFHNRSLQEEFVEYGDGAYDWEKYFPNEDESLAECLDRVRKDLMDNGRICVVDYDKDDNEIKEKIKFIPHNDIDVIRLDGEDIEIDKYRIDDLSEEERGIIYRLLDKFKEGWNVTEISKYLGLKGI